MLHIMFYIPRLPVSYEDIEFYMNYWSFLVGKLHLIGTYFAVQDCRSLLLKQIRCFCSYPTMLTTIAILDVENHASYILIGRKKDGCDSQILHHLTHVVRVLFQLSYSDQVMRFLESIGLPMQVSSKKKGLNYIVGRLFDLGENFMIYAQLVSRSDLLIYIYENQHISDLTVRDYQHHKHSKNKLSFCHKNQQRLKLFGLSLIKNDFAFIDSTRLQIMSLIQQQCSLNHLSTKIILNADDYGISPSIDQGIIELIQKGRLRSISAIVNEDQSIKAGQNLLQQLPSIMLSSISVGLHFNLTRGVPLNKELRNTRIMANGRLTKSWLRQKNLEQNLGEEIAEEFRCQLRRFIKIYKRRPSHIDGHNHIHLYPWIAQQIAPIMAQYGIYKVRIPPKSHLLEFDQLLAQNFHDVQECYRCFSIIWPSYFLGISGMIPFQQISNFISRDQQSINALQVMCHPGYPDQTKGWTSMPDRLKQKQQLQSQQFCGFIPYLTSYYDLHSASTSNKPRVLIYSKMQKGTGNFTTTQRYAKIFNLLGYQSFTWSVQSQIPFITQVQDLSKFLFSFGISLILGINVSRSGKVIFEATNAKDKIRMQVPYILVIAGTDANYSFKDNNKILALRDCLNRSQCIISISKDMKKITQATLQKLKLNKSIYTVVQSSCLGLAQAQESLVQFCDEERKVVLFPTSFRRIKCVEHVFEELNRIIDLYGLQVQIVGPIIQQQYYEELKDKLNKIQYLGTLNHNEYLKKLKKAFAVINCSQSQGMSCSIIQALQYGIPVVARNNSGNKELIHHNTNGMIYDRKEQFFCCFERLINEKQLRMRFTEAGITLFRQSYSLQAQISQFKQILNTQIQQKKLTIQIQGNSLSFFNETFVHHTSSVNNELYLQIQPQSKDYLSILDIGCGTSVFSLIYLAKTSFKRARLHLVDISNDIIGNAIYNYRQSSFWHKIEIFPIVQSNYFQKSDINKEFDAILFNPPQTPFQKIQSRLDKNGGLNGIKFYQLILPYFSHCKSKKLFLLHSYMAWPDKYQQLLKQYKLICKWRSEKGVHKIGQNSYQQMEQGLTKYIHEHWKQGRAQISFCNGQFFVPAEINSIIKQQ